MTQNNEIKVLLVEDNPGRDSELTLHSLRKRNLANHIVHLKDGQEALDWLFGPSSGDIGRDGIISPKVVLLDLKLPKADGLEVLRAIPRVMPARG